MQKTILDTNFLVLATKLKIDVKSELAQLIGKTELVTSNMAMGELERIAESRTKNALYARIALAQIKQKQLEVKIVESETHVDDWIAQEAAKDDVVCTNDRKLILRVKAKLVRVVCIKGKQKVGFC
ncbi:hypothetical protein HY992_01195 [Candidatus Micrarchaeota archaeon]|nr:hypothetical protein [Candidatus Micrarchaeota archaeon]